MASWIWRPDSRSSVGELNISNAAAERASAMVAFEWEAVAATGFGVEIGSRVEFVAEAVDCSVPTSNAVTSGIVTEKGALSRVAVVGAAFSDFGSSTNRIATVSREQMRSNFISRSPRSNFVRSGITVSGQP